MTSRDNTKLAVQLIKQIDLRDALPHYGVELRRNSAHCPFHDDHTPSFGVYNTPTGQRCHCLGCNWDGDLIQFVRDRFSLGFPEAVAQICADFGLPAPGDVQPADRQRLFARQTEAQKRRARITRAEEDRQRCETEWFIADSVLDSIPREQRTKDNDAYVDAIFARMSAERDLARAELKLYNLAHEGNPK